MINHVLDKSVKGNAEFLQNRINQLDPTKKWQVTARPYKSKRSLDQNSRLWEWYTALGNYIGYEREEVHELMGWQFLRSQKVINGINVEVIKSTTKLNTEEMTHYMESIERWASEIGFIWSDK